MEFVSLTSELALFLFTVAIVAGFLDTLAGGGGLLTLPALLLTGMPPLTALATNKLQSTMGTATATIMMFRNRRVRSLAVKGLMLAAFIGSVLGTLFVQFVNTQLLTLVIPIVVGGIGLYFLITPTISQQNQAAKVSALNYQRFLVPVIGFYDGVLGPGTGSFFTLAGRVWRGQAFLKATATAKTLNFATNFASLVVFLLLGEVFWLAGLTMVLGQFLGAWLGAHWLFKIPVHYLRYLIVCMCFAMLIKWTFF
jgi:hypothetical protein